jgi:hypothetical protein
MRYIELCRGIDNEAVLDEIRRCIMPWTPGHLKSEEVSKEFLSYDILDAPVKLTKREEDTSRKLIRKDLDDNEKDV